MSCSVKACFNCQKQDSGSDLKIRQIIIPIRVFLDYKSCFYFLKYQNILLPAFSGTNTIPTARMKYHSRTKKLVCNTKFSKEFMRKSFFISILPPSNSLPSCLVKKKFSSVTTKSKYEVLFSNKIVKQMEQPEHRKIAGEIIALVLFFNNIHTAFLRKQNDVSFNKRIQCFFPCRKE